MCSISIHIIFPEKGLRHHLQRLLPSRWLQGLRAHSLTDRLPTLLRSKCAGTVAFASLGGLPSLEAGTSVFIPFTNQYSIVHRKHSNKS